MTTAFERSRLRCGVGRWPRSVRRRVIGGAVMLGVCGALVGCGATALRSRSEAADVAVFSGRISFDARHPTPTGTSREVEERPARYVAVTLLDGAGEVLARGTTDASGRFELAGAATAATLRVAAHVQEGGRDVAISRDAGGRETHTVDVPLRDGEPVLLRADDRSGDGGAFHVLDTLVRGIDAARGWSGRDLPPLFVFWMRGGTREWSFYRGERPHGSGRFALELLGGEPGQASTSDTDEHDEAIILHELGHFVMDRVSGDSSTGGTHPTGALIDPGLAWEEGRATWFALAVLGDAVYQDTIGIEPWGRLRVDADLEARDDVDAVDGLGSEQSVSQILWDLSDGAPGLPDEDDDGISLGASAVLQAMIEHAAEPGAYASLPSFLDFLVRSGRVERPALTSMLQRTGQPVDALLPDAGGDPWPPDLEAGTNVEGQIDGMSQPAPSGGPNLSQTGFDAIHTYRIHVPRAGMLGLTLRIAGSGAASDRSNLDLELLDLRADRLADARTESRVEQVLRMVEPGWYIVRVRDAGSGNRASYELQTSVETL